MNKTLRKRSWIAAIALAGGVGILASCQSMQPMIGGERVTLSGANEVPTVTTSAAGTGTVTIKEDRSVSVKITVTGMTATAAHIHEAAVGANGPVIVPFTKVGDDTFVAPDGAKLTEAQYVAYKAGKLYVNVHSAKNPGGEIRAQLKGS
jgi:ABC-type Fe2+-enterobactin transport system substrate-binding protein